MKRPIPRTWALLFLVSSMSLSLVDCDITLAQEARDLPENSASSSEKEWYYGTTPTQTPQKTVGRQRAEQRALQRGKRLETMRWYGFSAGRPTATGIPFTSMYSPAWTRPGGRPYAWFTSQRPVVIVSPYYPAYYR